MRVCSRSESFCLGPAFDLGGMAAFVEGRRGFALPTLFHRLAVSCNQMLESSPPARMCPALYLGTPAVSMCGAGQYRGTIANMNLNARYLTQAVLSLC